MQLYQCDKCDEIYDSSSDVKNFTILKDPWSLVLCLRCWDNFKEWLKSE